MSVPEPPIASGRRLAVGRGPDTAQDVPFAADSAPASPQCHGCTASPARGRRSLFPPRGHRMCGVLLVPEGWNRAAWTCPPRDLFSAFYHGRPAWPSHAARCHQEAQTCQSPSGTRCQTDPSSRTGAETGKQRTCWTSAGLCPRVCLRGSCTLAVAQCRGSSASLGSAVTGLSK